MRLRRSNPLPDAVRAALNLQKGERALATAALTDGAWAVGTDRRLVLVDPDGTVRVDGGWHEVGTAGWDDESDVLAVEWLDGDRTWLALADPEDARFATLLRERVESSVVASTRVSVRGVGGARLVARRVGGRLVAQVVPDRATDPHDPRLADALRRGREELVDLVGPLDDA